MSTEHLDHALSEEFAGKSATIHTLKTTNAHFHKLLEHNHELWQQIQNIQNGITPTDDTTLEVLEKKRLKLLDEIASMVAAAN